MNYFKLPFCILNGQNTQAAVSRVDLVIRQGPANVAKGIVIVLI